MTQHSKQPETASDQQINTVADLTIQTLSNWGIKQVFGIDGPTHSNLTHTLLTQEAQGTLCYFKVNHENAAACAASAYGSLTGRPAACIVMGGSPAAATNLTAALWNTSANRAPVVVLTGSLDTQTQHQSRFKNSAQWTHTVNGDSDYAELANLACKNAILNRSVSHLIFPNETIGLALKEPMQAGFPQGRLPSQDIAPPHDALQDAIQLLRTSERPAIIVGHGARDRMAFVIRLAEQLRAPVITTLKGKGLIPDSHPLAGGVLGHNGSPVASELMSEADTLLVFGASFNKDTGITTKRPIVQVDYELTALAKSQPIDVPVWGEIGVTAKALSDEFLGDMWTQDQTAAIASHWMRWRAIQQQETLAACDQAINAAALFASLSETLDEDAIIAIDLDTKTDSFGRYFTCTQQSILMSGQPNSAGFAFPAAMGAWAATQEDHPALKDRQVIAISSDAGFDQSLADIRSAVHYEMNITHILINHGKPHKISAEQDSRKLDSLSDHSFVDYAERLGARGITITKANELKAALKQALNHPSPALIEVIIKS